MVREFSRFRQDPAWYIVVLNTIDYGHRPVLNLDLLTFAFKYRLGTITWVKINFFNLTELRPRSARTNKTYLERG